MYRCFISECTAIMNAESICEEININGDCVWGVFNTPLTDDIDTVFSVACSLNSLVKMMNYKLHKKNYSTISVGIGLDYGRALMVKAGYAGSKLNDIIWMGDVVNSASYIAGKAGREGRNPIIVSDCIYSDLNKYNQGLLHFTTIDWNPYYSGDLINASMDEWYDENCT